MKIIIDIDEEDFKDIGKCVMSVGEIFDSLRGKAYRSILNGTPYEGWIPTSVRLPKEDGCYLVTTTGTNNAIIDIAYYSEDIWHKASRIKAWMPLPLPYKSEKGGE